MVPGGFLIWGWAKALQLPVQLVSHNVTRREEKTEGLNHKQEQSMGIICSASAVVKTLIYHSSTGTFSSECCRKPSFSNSLLVLEPQALRSEKGLIWSDVSSMLYLKASKSTKTWMPEMHHEAGGKLTAVRWMLGAFKKLKIFFLFKHFDIKTSDFFSSASYSQNVTFPFWLNPSFEFLS